MTMKSSETQVELEAKYTKLQKCTAIEKKLARNQSLCLVKPRITGVKPRITGAKPRTTGVKPRTTEEYYKSKWYRYSFMYIL